MVRNNLDDMFHDALEELRLETYDSPVPHLVALHQLGTREVFDRAVALCASPDWSDRELGIRVVRELGDTDEDGHRPFSDEAIPMLVAMLGQESDPYLEQRILQALAYNGAKEHLELFLARVHHQNEHVRESVAFQLPYLAEPATHTQVVDALLEMCRDSGPEVRFYAFYALCNEPEDEGLLPEGEARDALIAVMLEDPDRHNRTWARDNFRP